MENIYRVAIHYNEDNGYIEYAKEEKAAKVVLETVDKKEQVESYLAQTHEINVPNETILDFSKRMVNPLNSLEEFKLSLTRLWGITGVYVDWSRPVNV
ncbi:hypothetical protein [Anaerosinus massiliensis]|uniref:hypothetical protein n=1 Tax=Massilibacillus massiliensis TaxID=1806837 RepID=UPI000DA5F912|nr:hypothetical protein [Massilibacillus massiliensis]